MQMRKSRVLQKMRDGKVAYSTKINLNDVRVVELAAMCGFDCIWLDMEHIPTDWSLMENQIRAAKIHDTDVLVRVARGSYSDYIRPLEADAAGIMVPHLMSEQDAKSIVWQTRFFPIGRRPLDGGNADAAYTLIDLQTYVDEANRERFIIVQIEDPEPMQDLEKIARVEGIDMLLFGPGDFGHGLGITGQFDHPDIHKARKQVLEVAHAHGKFAGTVASLATVKEYVDMGFDFLNLGADVLALCDYWQNISRALHDLG